MDIDTCRLILIRDVIEDRANGKLDNKLRVASPCDAKPIENQEYSIQNSVDFP